MGMDDRPTPLQAGDPRLLVRWARRYAKSRTISFLVQWVIIVVMVGVIGAGAEAMNMAYRSGNWGFFGVAVTVMGGFFAVLLWFAASSWGGEVVSIITAWLYGQEGYATCDEGDRRGPSTGLLLLSAGLMAHHILGALLCVFNGGLLQYLQPFSALYMTPFLCVLIFQQRLGWWAWIWPVCYGLHAVLILMGAPLLFGAHWLILNLVAPLFGYGLLAILAGHAYSRYALYQLKRLARAGLSGASQGESGGGGE